MHLEYLCTRDRLEIEVSISRLIAVNGQKQKLVFKAFKGVSLVAFAADIILLVVPPYILYLLTKVASRWAAKNTS